MPCLSQNTTMSSVNPYHNVFATAELLESILRHLPVGDLLLAQRVSRTFKNTISSSPMLQQNLFFQPRPVDRVSRAHNEPEMNPLLRDAFPPWFEHCDSACEFHDLDSFESLDWDRNPQQRTAFARKEATWRSMLVIQPACTTLQVVQCILNDGDDKIRSREICFDAANRKGVRMGALYDLAEEWVCEIGSWRSFGCQWHMFRQETCFPSIRKALETGSLENRIAVMLYCNIQCDPNGPPLRPEFRSLAFEKPCVEFPEEPREASTDDSAEESTDDLD